MTYFKSKGVRIYGLACAVPKNKVYIKDYEKFFGKEIVSRFINNTGIATLRRTIVNQTASDLGYEAAKELILKLNISPKEIGLLVFASQSPDYRKPATACVLQSRLMLDKSCAAFDVNLGCSSFVYCNQLVTSMLKESCDKKYALLILGETSSKLVSPDDESTAMMFGDAGAAIIYEKKIGSQINTLLMTDGNRFKSIIVPSGGFRDMYPENEYYVTQDGKRRSKYCSYMDGVSVFSFAITDVVNSIKEFLILNEKTINDYDYIVLHQANNLILKRIAHKLGILEKKVLLSLEEYGNTSGVSIPLTLSKNFSQLGDGEKHILVVGYGIGLSWGVSSLTIDTKKILGVIETNSVYNEGIIK